MGIIYKVQHKVERHGGDCNTICFFKLLTNKTVEERLCLMQHETKTLPYCATRLNFVFRSDKANHIEIGWKTRQTETEIS